MRVAHLSLRDFRNYATAELELRPGANLLLGRNGQGKTNLAEAIAYFSSLRSHRVSSDTPLVRFGTASAYLRLKVEANQRTVLLDLQINKEGANRGQVNGNGVPTREIPRWFAAVSFVPEDLSIVRGEPSLRRRFLDDALVSRHPAAAGVLNDYDRVLRQRTALLKSARGRPNSIESTLGIWDSQLVELGTQIMLARREYVEASSGPLVEAYSLLVGEDHAPYCSLIESALGDVSRETDRHLYGSTVSRETIEEKFRETLSGLRRREIERGVTLAGPHRDDLAMTLNGLPVKGYASHGESWSFALGLKLSLANVLRADSSAGDPVLILDDVFAELDQGRRARLMRAVDDFEQVIVTAAVESDVPEDVGWNIVRISKGEIVAGTDDMAGEQGVSGSGVRSHGPAVPGLENTKAIGPSAERTTSSVVSDHLEAGPAVLEGQITSGSVKDPRAPATKAAPEGATAPGHVAGNIEPRDAGTRSRSEKAKEITVAGEPQLVPEGDVVLNLAATVPHSATKPSYSAAPSESDVSRETELGNTSATADSVPVQSDGARDEA